MATVTSPVVPFDRADVDRRVRHPLQTIRGVIFRYVLVEGIALTVFFVAMCFWLGLACDFLPWSAFSFDWLYTFEDSTGELPATVIRVTILAITVIGLGAYVVYKIFFRLFKEFSDAAVAMLLERRFPNELGDRLITAVELADPKLSEKYGYSQAMVDKTIRDAAERVQSLPVRAVFRWRRLWFKVGLAAFATGGIYLLVGLTWCIANGASPVDFAVRFHHTASIWAERDVLLRDSYWPPNTMIELVRFPGKELQVPRDEERPDVKVRFVRWAIADDDRQTAPRGWRAMRFSDLKNLLPSDMLDVQLPADWDHWIVDLDDLDARVPESAVNADQSWQGMTSGHVWRDLRLRATGIVAGGFQNVAGPSAFGFAAAGYYGAFVQPDVEGQSKLLQIVDRGSGAKDAPPIAEGLAKMLDWHEWTVDKIELQLQYVDAKAKKKTVEGALAGTAVEAALLQSREQPVAAAMSVQHKAQFDKLQAIFAKLEELANDPHLVRVVRKLSDPDENEVVAHRKAKGGSGTNNCVAVNNHKFIFSLTKLGESCQFSISTQDYWTPWRDITLVPPPAIDRFMIDKEEPAYLYYRMPENPGLLKGKRQKISSVGVSTSGAFTLIAVPLGTNVTLIAHGDRKLKEVRIGEPDVKKREEKTSITVPAIVQLAADRQTFSCSFTDVQRIIEFDFEYKDEFGVKGSRRVIIMPLVDQAPRINELSLLTSPRVLHATDESLKGIAGGPRFVITPDAFIKWRGKVEDDHGLAKLEYKYELQEIDFQNIFADPTDAKSVEGKGAAKKPSRAMGGEIATGGLLYVPGPSAFGFFAVGYYGGLANIVNDGSLPPPPPRTDIVGLERSKWWLNKRAPEDATTQELARLLLIQPANRKLLLEILPFSPEKRTLAAFAERLKDANQTGGFLREMMDFTGIHDSNERADLDSLAANDAAEALAKVLKKLQGDAAQIEATAELLKKDPEKKILTRYELQSEDPVFGFDVKEQLRFVKAIGSQAVQKHYALRVTIIATDTNVDTGPGVTSASPLYSFLIISENQLLSLMMIDQRKYYDLLDQVVKELEKSRGNLESELFSYRKAADDPVKMLLRADAARKAVRDGGITSKAVLVRFEAIVREMEFNRFQQERIGRLKTNVSDPLSALTTQNGLFPKAEELVQKLHRELSPDADKKDKADLNQAGNDPALIQELLANKDKHIKNAEMTLVDINELIRELHKIKDFIFAGLTEDRLIEDIERIQAIHNDVDLMLRRFQQEWRIWFINSIKG
ncbi:MAG TPA: hypothetical protein VE988_22015 [Gemmataceae bacterium]|nr:hypothetical protein [Gemmataceae bacterium]